MTSPWRAPSALKATKAASRHRLRRKMSRLTTSRRRNACAAARSPARSRRRSAAPHQPEAERQAAILGDDRGPATPATRPAEAEHEQQSERDVDAVGHDQERHRGARVLQAEQPAEQDHGDQRRGRAEQADREIGLAARPRPARPARTQRSPRRSAGRSAGPGRWRSARRAAMPRREASRSFAPGRRGRTPAPSGRWCPCAGSRTRSRRR